MRYQSGFQRGRRRAQLLEPKQRSWAVLHQAGFTETRLRPEDERELLGYGCGITAAVTRPTPRSAEISAAEFRRASPVFEAKMRRYEPRVIAFLGKRALSAMLATSEIPWGRQVSTFGGATSGGRRMATLAVKEFQRYGDEFLVVLEDSAVPGVGVDDEL
ncbi:hypothetical protein BH11ACT6_BH11ACT6_48520 [soil metagenome]